MPLQWPTKPYISSARPHSPARICLRHFSNFIILTCFIPAILTFRLLYLSTTACISHPGAFELALTSAWNVLLPDTYMAWSLNPFRSLLKCHRPKEAFSHHLISNNNTPQTFLNTAFSPWHLLYWHIYMFVARLPSLEYKLHVCRDLFLCTAESLAPKSVWQKVST